jgi:hypothetical protein
MACEYSKVICDILIVKATMVAGLRTAFGFMAMTTISAFHFGLEWIGKTEHQTFHSFFFQMEKLSYK